MSFFSGQELQYIQRKQKELEDGLFMIKALAENGQMEEANEEAVGFALASEKLAEQVRNMIAYSGHPNAREMLNEMILKSVPVSIKYTPEGWFMMSMPALMPDRKRGNMDYLRGYLYPFLERFMDENPRRQFGKSVIAFRLIYDHERPECQFRDFDNYEINTVVDAVAFYLLPSDGPMHLEHFYCTAPGEASCTEVYLVPREDFKRFYLALKAAKLVRRKSEPIRNKREKRYASNPIFGPFFDAYLFCLNKHRHIKALGAVRQTAVATKRAVPMP